MAEIKKTEKISVQKERTILFTRDNYIWMAIGAVIIALGMILMTGGKNQDPNVFDTSVVYSTMRITIAPIVIILGFVVEIYAIFKKPQIHS
ncbi:MAG TPA: DUF3098 domain-containing protein [Chitinophagaceae bacterium]